VQLQKKKATRGRRKTDAPPICIKLLRVHGVGRQASSAEKKGHCQTGGGGWRKKKVEAIGARNQAGRAFCLIPQKGSGLLKLGRSARRGGKAEQRRMGEASTLSRVLEPKRSAAPREKELGRETGSSGGRGKKRRTARQRWMSKLRWEARQPFGKPQAFSMERGTYFSGGIRIKKWYRSEVARERPKLIK